MKLSILAKKLYYLSLYKEAAQILKLASKEVFAHISGPSGSGKTTIMEEIASLHPDVVAKDLDEFDEEANKAMDIPDSWKHDSSIWTQEIEETQFALRQRLLDDFLERNSGRKIILAGHHTEWGKDLQFNAKHKILLNTSTKESMERRIKRDREWGKGWNFWENEEDLTSELEESEEIVKYLMIESYVPMGREEILSLFED